jgi:PAS domain S-box-containing protein
MKASNILVVEDDPRMRESIRILLDFHGYRVQTEGTLNHALRSLITVSYDLVILDIQLEDKSGFEVMDYMATKKLDTQVIIVTGEESENNAITALKSGAADYLKKPFEPDNLLQSVDRILAHQKQNREKKWAFNSIKKITDEKEKYRQLAEFISDWIWEVDRHYDFTYTNPVVFDLLGYKPEEVIGKKPFDFMIEHDAQRLDSHFRYLLAKGKPIMSVESINIHKDGTRVALETNGIPIFREDGTVVGYRGVDRNISTRKWSQTKHLSGILPICASCNMIRGDEGHWSRFETYIENHSNAEFSHTICPLCAKKLYPDL